MANLKNKTYWAEINFQADGRVKIAKAKKLTGVNQYKQTWKNTDSRNLGRKLNRAEYLIK